MRLDTGASGSPLLLESQDGPVAIAINVIEFPFARILPQLRRKLPKALRKRSDELATIFAANSAVSTAAFHEQIELLQHPSEPLPREQIRLIQDVLRSTGNYKGALDGLYGAGTRQAILDLERRQNLLPTGQPTLRLVAVYYFNSGNNYLRKGKFDQAISYFGRAIKLDPKNASAFNNRGRAFIAKEYPMQAIADFEEAIHLNTKDYSAYLGRGMAYLIQGRGTISFERAITDLDRAIQLNPHSAAAYRYRAQAHMDKYELDPAINDITVAINLQTNTPEYHLLRARIYEKRGDIDRALADYTQVIRFKPKHAYYYSRRGSAFQEKGDIDRAISDFTQAIKLEPAKTLYYSQRARAYQKAGKRYKAIIDFRMILKIDPYRSDAKKQLREMGADP
jgi:tetratricopeptide (TPR) repeat protein